MTSAEVNSFRIRERGEPVVGHYTTLVWANTTQVGCGFLERDVEMQGIGQVRPNLLVIIPASPSIPAVILLYLFLVLQYMACNYGPGGNIVGHSIYNFGATGSECTNGLENGLCL